MMGLAQVSRAGSGDARFLRICAGVDVRDMQHEIQAHCELWAVGTLRQQRIPAQRETASICLRSARRVQGSSGSVDDIHESGNTPLARQLPTTLRWVETFACQRGRELGRALLAKLKPRGQVYSHVDHGDYYRIRDRFHLVLFSARGSQMVCGAQTQLMREGEVWWFDNKQPHAALNGSDEDRIHLIFDLSMY